MIPEVGKTYDHFDDGKIKMTRHYEVKITEVIPFKEAPPYYLELWEEQVSDCPWLYTTTTDYFVIGRDVGLGITEPLIYVRAVEEFGELFSLGYWAGVLDVDGSLMKDIQEERS